MSWVDPSGLWTLQVGLSFTAGGIFGTTKGGGLIIGRDPSTGEFQIGLYAVGGAGVFVGAEGSAAFDITLSGNPCIEDVEGFATTVGGSASLFPLLPVSPGAGFESNTPLTGNAKPSYTLSGDVSAGLPAEGHGFVTYTHVQRVW